MFAVARMSSLAAGRRLFQCTSKSLRSAADSTVKPAVEAAKEPAKEVVNEGFAKKNPFTFQLIIATGKTMAADLMAQTVAEGKKFDEIDWKRNGIFIVFGFAYLGGFQYWLMINKYRQWFPSMDRFAKLTFAQKLKDTAGLIDAAKMIVFDLVVHLPVIYFPCYYTVKELVSGASWNPFDWVKNGVTKYSKNMEEDLSAMIKLWGPSDCIQFVLPLHIRLPFRHFVSFFWTAYVSFTRGSVEKVPAAVDDVTA